VLKKKVDVDTSLDEAAEFAWRDTDNELRTVLLKPFTVRQSRAFTGRMAQFVDEGGANVAAIRLGEGFAYAYGYSVKPYNANPGEYFMPQDVDTMSADDLDRLAELGLKLNPDILKTEDSGPLGDAGEARS
jgi:hypothetical protein